VPQRRPAAERGPLDQAVAAGDGLDHLLREQAAGAHADLAGHARDDRHPVADQLRRQRSLVGAGASRVARAEEHRHRVAHRPLDLRVVGEVAVEHQTDLTGALFDHAVRDQVDDLGLGAVAVLLEIGQADLGEDARDAGAGGLERAEHPQEHRARPDHRVI
jgi:hypothetical protein